jgi:XRE family aerobic/anaerobic benzoate catabolism transcriptional regulator
MAIATTGSALLRRIAERVRAARKARGLTIREAAERSALSPRFFTALESGSANIAIGRLAQVAVALNIPLVDLVADEPGARRRVVALVGLRGAGKSTQLPLIATALDRAFIELDDMIEEDAGLALSEIFAMHGEGFYRKLEARALTSLVAAHEPWVVALSGGIVHNEGAWEIVQRRCTTVWLKASPEEHMSRVVAQGDTRPMRDRADAMAELETLLAQRAPLYELADITVSTSGKTAEQTLIELLEALQAIGMEVSVP